MSDILDEEESHKKEVLPRFKSLIKFDKGEEEYSGCSCMLLIGVVIVGIIFLFFGEIIFYYMSISFF